MSTSTSTTPSAGPDAGSRCVSVRARRVSRRGRAVGVVLAVLAATVGGVATASPASAVEPTATATAAVTAIEPDDGVVLRSDFHSAARGEFGVLLVDGVVARDAGTGEVLRVAAGTSPAATGLTKKRAYVVAFQDQAGQLAVIDNAGAVTRTGLAMRPGTSPSVTSTFKWGTWGRWTAAVQDDTGHLATYTSDPKKVDHTPWAMAAGTTPTITSVQGSDVADGIEIGFQSDRGELWLVGDRLTLNTHLGMRAGTSPSTTSAAGYKRTYTAFQANTGKLFFYNTTDGAYNTHLGMRADSSPSIGAYYHEFSSDDLQVAFVADTGMFWSVGDRGNLSTQDPVAPGTNPSLTFNQNGDGVLVPMGHYQAVFQGADGYMKTWDNEAGQMTTDWTALAAGTTPSVASPWPYHMG